MIRHATLAGTLAGAALAAAVAAAPASANPYGSVSCARADAGFVGYPVQEVRFLLEVVDRGTPLTSARFTFTGPDDTTTIPLGLSGSHVLELYGTRLGAGFGQRVRLAGPTALECGPTSPPVPNPPEVTPPPAPPTGQPPASSTPLTCAELLAKYPKAGPKRRAGWGCPITRKPKPRPPMTCERWKVLHPGAPAGAYRRAGFVPVCGQGPDLPPPRRYSPPVAG